MNLYIDTRENKSAVAWDLYFGQHLEIFELYQVEHLALQDGDVMAENHLIEYKIGNDALSSLNNGHLEQQLQRLFAYKNLKEKYLIVCATDIITFSRCCTLAQKYGVIIYYRSSLTDAIQLSDHLIREVYEGRELHQDPTIPILEHRKAKASPFAQRMALALSQLVYGLSEEAATHLVKVDCECLSDFLNSITPAIIRETLDTFYNCNKKALAKAVCAAIWGAQP